MNTINRQYALAGILILFGLAPAVTVAQTSDAQADLLLKKMATQMQLEDEHALSQIEEMTINSDHKEQPFGKVVVEWRNVLGDVHTQELKAKDPSFKSMFGFDAAVEGGVAAVGAPKEGLMKTGATYIYTYEDGEWLQDNKVLAKNGEANDGFGYQVEVYGDKVIVAAPGRDTDAADEGVVFVYEKMKDGWGISTELEAKGFYPDMHFGREIYIENGMLAISVTTKKESLAGFKYEFDLEGNKSGKVELLPIGTMPDTEPDINAVHDVVSNK